jgi:uncharacterized protein YegP (UPF0339 family)
MGMTARFRLRRSADETYQWMLLSANNRLIGISITSYPDVESAIRSAERARAIAEGGTMGFTVGEQRQWYWRLDDDGVPLATSSSGFARRLDAERAAQRFRRAAITAGVQLGLVVVPERVRRRPGPSRDPGFPTRSNGMR